MPETCIKDPILFSPSSILDVLESYKAKGFNIPIYQRLYAWTNKEITKFLDDINDSSNYTTEKDYYIGNLTLNYNKVSCCYDVIDGQQRMTTLWLIGLVLKRKGHTDWLRFMQRGDVTLLRFTAREDDNTYLNDLVYSVIHESSTIIEENINPMMFRAIKTIEDYISVDQFNIDNFSKYTFSRVKLAAIFLPDNIDLNKYFEDMNNRGLQLEAHHIVKAKLLSKIKLEYQNSYAKVWDAVSQMNQYIEYGFEGTLVDNRENILNKAYSYLPNNVINNSAEEIDIQKEIELRRSTLKNLFDKASDTVNKEDNQSEKDDYEKTISIVSFPEFLIHCLMIHLDNYDIPLDDKKLAKTFDEYIIEINAEKFIKDLFILRICFDKFFIKSVTTNEGTKWEIRRINADTNDKFIREKYFKGRVVQLQSMLNASTSSNLWLTKALKFASLDEFTEDSFFANLEEIDKSIHNVLPTERDLNQGTGTNRYWFYKLDYLLWLEWTKEDSEIPKIQGIDDIVTKIKNFQFRDSRSVEHLHPRNPISETWIKSEKLSLNEIKDSFGNLTLISSSSNSSYSNQSFENKKDDFVKRTKNWGIESLKQVDIFSNTDWTVEIKDVHQERMIRILNQ